jgi:hypothetical protein
MRWRFRSWLCMLGADMQNSHPGERVGLLGVLIGRAVQGSDRVRTDRHDAPFRPSAGTWRTRGVRAVMACRITHNSAT